MYYISLDRNLSEQIFLRCNMDKESWRVFFSNILGEKSTEIIFPFFLFEVISSIYNKQLPNSLTIQILSQRNHIYSEVIIKSLYSSLYDVT